MANNQAADSDMFTIFMNQQDDLPDGACILVNLPNDLKSKIHQAQLEKQKYDRERVAAQGSSLVERDIKQEIMLQNIIDQEDELKGDKVLHQVQDDQLSINSYEKDAYGDEDAKKLAQQRVKDLWKIEVGQLVLSTTQQDKRMQFVINQSIMGDQIEPDYKKGAQVYDVIVDAQNHPIHEPVQKAISQIKQIQQQKFTNRDDTNKINLEKAQIQLPPSDAYVLRQKFTKKRDAKMKIKVQRRLFKTLRLKPSVINTSRLMQEVQPLIKNFDPKQVDAKEEWKRKIYVVPAPNPEYQSDTPEPAYGGRRYAKSEDELRQDILKLFRVKPKWTMYEIKAKMPDQPDKPVEQQVKILCKDPTGTSGSNAKYELKDTFK